METWVQWESDECCSWCRRPAELCQSASCDDAPTYSGVLHRGQWVEEELVGALAASR